MTETDPGAGAPDPLAALDRKLDTIAGALAAVAATQKDLLETAAGHRADLALALEVLAGIAESLDRVETRTEDRLAAIRDAASAPVADLQALLAARSERSEAQLDQVAARVEEAVAERLESLEAAAVALAARLPEIGEDLAGLREAVEGLDVTGPLQDTADGLADDLRDHTTAALAGTLRVLDERLSTLRSAIVAVPAPPPAPPAAAGMGFEAGAVMGATQAAWNRLEQRLDAEFDDLGRQLQAMSTLVERALATAEAAAHRPVVTGEQLRRTASSVRDAVVQANRSRRDRRGGPRGLGPGSPGA